MAGRKSEERRKFMGLGRVLRDLGEIKGGVKIRYENVFSLSSLFVPQAGPPTLNVMEPLKEPMAKFISKDDDGLCFAYCMEFKDGCFLSGDGAWLLIHDVVSRVVEAD